MLSTGTTSGEGPLVGRVRELSELRETYADARAGRGGVHLVLGDPGVGKTRLAAALAEHAAADGATVVWTRGWGRAAPAYWPWVEVVRSLCADVDGPALRAALGDGVDELVRLAPELAERLPGAGPAALASAATGVEETSQIARFALFGALVSLLRLRGAQAPVVVLIDDLQAVDEGSLVALDFVSRTLRGLSVLLVVTMHERVPERTPDAQAALSNIVRAGRRLILGGLSSADIGELIELTSGVAPPPALARAVRARTEGNAFFVREIVALLLAEGRLEDPPDELPLPDGVRETIRRRLEPLDVEAVRTLELAAILGRTFHLAALEHASPLHRDQVLTALDQAARLGLVVELPATVGRYRFGHGLIGDTLLAGMSAAARMAAHAAAGEALEHVYRGAIDAHLPELAHHFLSAAPRGDLYRAVDYAQRAAHGALDNLAYEQAEELFDRALAALELLEIDIPRRAALLLGRGTAQSRAGRPAARASFDAAIGAARAIGDHDTLARAALGAAPFALTPGFVDDQHVALLVEALERAGPGDCALRVRLLGSLATALYWSDAAPRRAQLAREALEMARRLGDDATLAFALSAAQLATSGPDNTGQGLEWLRALFELTDGSGHSVLSIDARSRFIDLLIEVDDLAAADVAIGMAERTATAARDRRAMAFVPIQRARRMMLEGRFAPARALLAEVAAISHEMPDTTIPLTVNSQLAVLGWIQHGVGAIGDVRAYADGVPAMPIWRAALAASLAANGRRAEAQREFDRLAARDFAALPRDNLWLGAMAALAESTALLDARDVALRLHAELAPFAARNVVTPTVAFLGPVEMWLGILAGVAGRDTQALEHLGRARASATRNGARASLARIAVEEATVLVRDRGRDARRRAEELLTEAAREREEMGMTAMADRIAALRDALAQGAPEPAPALSAAPPAAEAASSAGAPVADVTSPATSSSSTITASLRRIGDVWTIDDGRVTLHLNDARGVRLLALLLSRPGEEIHSLDLVAIVDGGPAAGRGARDQDQQVAGRAAIQDAAGPRLDDEAKASYRARLQQLRGEIAAALARGDAAREQRARTELAFVERELGLAVGLRGRDRDLGASHAERARVNVTRAIRSTLRRIASCDARLGRELDAAVRTGTYCAYEPDPQRPRRWVVGDAPGR
jgi:hypothetical protein